MVRHPAFACEVVSHVLVPAAMHEPAVIHTPVTVDASKAMNAPVEGKPSSIFWSISFMSAGVPAALLTHVLLPLYVAQEMLLPTLSVAPYRSV